MIIGSSSHLLVTVGGPDLLRGVGFFIAKVAFFIDGFNLYHALGVPADLEMT